MVVMDKFSGGELKVSMQTGERLGGVAAAAEDPSSDDVVHPFFFYLRKYHYLDLFRCLPFLSFENY